MLVTLIWKNRRLYNRKIWPDCINFERSYLWNKVCNVSKCNASNTPDITCSLKSYIQTPEREINFLRSELQAKNAFVKSLVTSDIFFESVHVSYKNVETNPCNSSRKIISTTEIS